MMIDSYSNEIEKCKNKSESNLMLIEKVKKKLTINKNYNINSFL